VEQLPDEQLLQPEELPVPTNLSVPLKANLDIFFSRFSFLHWGQQTDSLDLKTMVSKSSPQSRQVYSKIGISINSLYFLKNNNHFPNCFQGAQLVFPNPSSKAAASKGTISS
jgi:hypothetical protein